MDPRVRKMAEVIVNYSSKVRAGDLVMIHLYEPPGEPLALALYEEVLKAGGRGVFNMAPSRWRCIHQ